MLNDTLYDMVKCTRRDQAKKDIFFFFVKNFISKEAVSLDKNSVLTLNNTYSQSSASFFPKKQLLPLTLYRI